MVIVVAAGWMRIAGGGAVYAARWMRIAGGRRGDVEVDSLREREVSLEAVIEIGFASFLLLLIMRKEGLCNVSINATF